jgi:hypothetical protein
MFASRSWLVCLAVFAGCSSSESGAPLPEGAPGIDPSASPSRVTERSGGQSGTDSGGAYNCDPIGAPPLCSVPLDQTPEGYACSPAAVLDAISGSGTFECTVHRSMLVAPVTDTQPANYTYSESAGPSLTLRLERGTAAHLLDAVLTREDGSTGSCTWLGVDASVSVASADGGVAISADQVVVDRFCSSASVYANARVRLFGNEEDAALLLGFELPTGRVYRLDLYAETYALVCDPSNGQPL